MNVTNSSNHPLISFILLAYNQAKYIAEAIEGAFSQSYQPLEIIVSDDCSTDRTYEIMKQLVDVYQGPHRVILNRMKHNSGLTAHLNKAVDLSSGIFLVWAAGDDISYPHRVEYLFNRWAISGFSSGSVYSLYTSISENGHIMQNGGGEDFRTATSWQRIKDRDPRIFLNYPGCTNSCTRDSFEIFGKLKEGIQQEDILLQLRSALIGGVGFVNEPLIKYRMTTISVSRLNYSTSTQRVEKMRKYLSSYNEAFEQFKKECVLACQMGYISPSDRDWALTACTRRVRTIRMELSFWQGGFRNRIKAIFSSGIGWGRRLRWLLYWMFPWIYGKRSYIRISQLNQSR